MLGGDNVVTQSTPGGVCVRWVLALTSLVTAIAIVATRDAGPRVVEGGTAAWSVRFHAPSNWGPGPFERWMPTTGLRAVDGSPTAWLLVLPSGGPAPLPEGWQIEDRGAVSAAGLHGRMFALRRPGGPSTLRAHLDDPTGAGWQWRLQLWVMPGGDLESYRSAFELALRTLEIEWH